MHVCVRVHRCEKRNLRETAIKTNLATNSKVLLVLQSKTHAVDSVMGLEANLQTPRHC